MKKTSEIYKFLLSMIGTDSDFVHPYLKKVKVTFTLTGENFIGSTELIHLLIIIPLMKPRASTILLYGGKAKVE